MIKQTLSEFLSSLIKKHTKTTPRNADSKYGNISNFAKKIGYSRQYLSYLINNHTKLPPGVFIRLQKYVDPTLKFSDYEYLIKDKNKGIKAQKKTKEN